MERWVTRGGYGVVGFAHDFTSNRDVAIKVECGLEYTGNECTAFETLKGISGIPDFIESLRFGPDHAVLFIERLGSDLDVFMRNSGGFLHITTVFTLGRALVKTLKEVHARGVIHRDIKPSNILLPRNEDPTKPYLTDFGLATPWRDPKTGQHIPPYRSRVGTPMFKSVNAHWHIRCSRRDDIESLAYTLIYLAHGSLPWHECDSSPEYIRKKTGFTVCDLSTTLPQALQQFLDHAKGLKYEEEPQYALLENLLQ